mmetsp:Transcript_3530/g.7360  ORF Transcript_3530/g.7360 Transcript_3530/m.7360 type:complete len:262 (-) Transcript_3530:210-995(-)
MNSKALLLLSVLTGTAAFQPAVRPTAGGTPLRTPSSLGLSRENNVVDDSSESRRAFCARSVATLAGALALSTAAAPSHAADLTPYDDADYGFKFMVPSAWETTEQKLSGRRKAIFFTDPNSKDAETGTVETLGFVAYTPVRDDFTTLGSFGSVDQVAQTTILPKGELAGLDDASQMLSAVSKNNAYYFDYVATPVVPTEPGSSGALTKKLKKQHFRTIFTLLPLKNSAGMTLVTITLQTTEDRYGDVKGVFDGVVDSYGKA